MLGGTPLFGQALQVLLPGATGAQLRALFDNRVSRVAVIRWRDGKRAAPKWARDIVQARMRERARAIEDLAAAIDRLPELDLAAMAANARKAKGAQLRAP